MNPALILLVLALAASPAALAAAAPAPPTDITSDSLEMHSSDTHTYSTFTRNVAVSGNNIRITCDRLEVVSTRIGDKTDTVGRQAQFESLLATGHVRIVQGDREATCGRAEVRPQEDKIVLTEGPVVTDHGNGSVLAGESITMFRNQRKVLVEHPHGVLPPVKDLGFDKNEPAPQPPAPAAAPAKQP